MLVSWCCVAAEFTYRTIAYKGGWEDRQAAAGLTNGLDRRPESTLNSRDFCPLVGVCSCRWLGGDIYKGHLLP